jgi:hypothetical protein
MSKLISLVMSVMLLLTGSVAWAQSLPSAKRARRPGAEGRDREG